ncbi:transmembrane protein 238-like [Cololabis saira]|uniref:transmembrane protein 238-like n=1 Tax=Cololabis saira TaxID=129043 RepID=UPI002AD2CCB8|nr:transmembrane protein 238-like [Cololabis saira]
MEPLRCVGGCLPLLLAAVGLDLAGLVLLFLGIFADLRLDGRFYGDFLIYTGALLVFFSLACWLMWYVGNVRASERDVPRKRSSFALLARKLSERLSERLSRSLRRDDAGAKCAQPGEDGAQPGKSGKVTWGKSTAYYNQGYDGTPDSPEVEKKSSYT